MVAKVFVKLLDPNRALLVRWNPTERLVTDFKPRLARVVVDGVELQVPEVPTLTLARMPAAEHGADVHKVIIAGYFDVDDEVATRLRGRIDVPSEYVVEFVEKSTGTRPLAEGLDYEEIERPTLTAGLLA
jgi:hypothetical protein